MGGMSPRSWAALTWPKRPLTKDEQQRVVGMGAFVKKYVLKLLGRRPEIRDMGDDLVQAANVGLMNAAVNYDSARGTFPTYAFWWVRESIKQEVLARGRKDLEVSFEDIDREEPTHDGGSESRVLMREMGEHLSKLRIDERSKRIFVDWTKRETERGQLEHTYGLTRQRLGQISARVSNALREQVAA